MSKTSLILKHEFLALVKRKGFIVMTVVFPLIGFAAIGIYLIVQGVGTGEREVPIIGYVDEVGVFAEYTTQGELDFISFDTRDHTIFFSVCRPALCPAVCLYFRTSGRWRQV